MTAVLAWLGENKDWLFSGAGVVIIVGALSLIRRSLARRRDSSSRERAPAIPWKGVDVRGRYFAWDGPNLHSLADRSPIPAPEIAIQAIRKLGGTPSFGLKERLPQHLASGAMQVYETDRETWRRELLEHTDGSQVLLVREPNGGGAA